MAGDPVDLARVVVPYDEFLDRRTRRSLEPKPGIPPTIDVEVVPSEQAPAVAVASARPVPGDRDKPAT